MKRGKKHDTQTYMHWFKEIKVKYATQSTKEMTMNDKCRKKPLSERNKEVSN